MVNMSKRGWCLRDYVRALEEAMVELRQNVAEAHHALEELEDAIEDAIEGDRRLDTSELYANQDRALTGEAKEEKGV